MRIVYHLALTQQLDFVVVQAQLAQAGFIEAHRIHRKRVFHMIAGLNFFARNKGSAVLAFAAMLVKEALFQVA